MDIHIDVDRPKVRQRRSRMIRAILAGGLVLGIGTAVTLAAWNDSEFVTGTFTAGKMNIQGSTDGSSYTDNAVSPGGALTFTVNPASLTPGDTVYAPFAVRIDSTSTYNANVVLSVATTGTVADLTYTLVRPATFGCSAGSTDTTGTPLVAAGTVVTSVGAGPPNFDVTHGAGVAGTPVFLCFKVLAGAGLTPLQSGTVTWQFAATSTTT